MVALTFALSVGEADPDEELQLEISTDMDAGGVVVERNGKGGALREEEKMRGRGDLGSLYGLEGWVD